MSRKPARLVALTAAIATLLAVAEPSLSAEITAPSRTSGGAIPRGVRIDSAGVFANFYRADVKGRAPGILIFGGSEGGLSSHFNEPAKRLTEAGFHVLFLCYFACPGKPQQLVDVPLETFDRGLAFLRAQPGVDPERIAVAGVSKGAEAALLVATRDRKLKAVIAAEPSSVVWPGIAYVSTSSSWTSFGAPVPFLHYTARSYANAFLGLLGFSYVDMIYGFYSGALPALAQHPEAAIPVERITAPILIVCGEADRLWPSCTMAHQIRDRLKAKARPAPIVLQYKNAGHAAFGPPIEKNDPEYARLARAGGTLEGNAAAHADSWPKAVAFLKSALGEAQDNANLSLAERSKKAERSSDAGNNQ